MKNLRRRLSTSVIAILFATIVTASASAQEWVSNGSYSMKIKGFSEHTSLDGVPLQRVDKKVKKYAAEVEREMKNEDYKLILLDAALRNDTSEEKDLGYSAWVTNDFYRTIYLRGDEGTEVNPLQDRGSYRPGQGGRIENGFTFYLKGGMPMASKVSPGSVVSGKIAYWVPVWYTPELAFTKIKSTIAGDSPTLFGKTRLKQRVSTLK